MTSNDPLARELYEQHERSICEHTDRLFVGLMLVQWAAAIAAALWITPLTWAGTSSRVHLHVWAAIGLGGLITLLPVGLALTQPGRYTTRLVIATTQMLMSSLLIHFTGGRIETHFHVFASLVLLSFYRDWRVLVPATVVVAADHFIRGVYWPESVFGIATASHWRWLEHAAWVLFEDVFLIGTCVRGKREMWSIAERTAALHRSEERHRRRAVEAIENSEVRNAAIVGAALDCIISFDCTGAIVEFNPTAERTFGCTRDEVIGRDVIALIAPPDLRKEYAARLQRYVTGEIEPDSVRREGRGLRADGSEFSSEYALTYVVIDGVQLFTCFLRDVTEQKQAEEALRQSEANLRQANKMDAIGQLAGGIAHDFNNLLTAIVGYAEVVSDKLRHDRTLHGYMEQISRAGQAASGLTRQLLAFSRRQVLQPVVLDVNSVIADVDKMLRRLIGEHIDLSTDLAGDLRFVRADAGQLEQVIVNLAVNARDAMRAGGRLTLDTRNIDLEEGNRFGLPSGEAIELRVTDTGCGMDEATLARVFEPFFTTKEPGKGTGLGLSTVYGIVTQSGGAVAVESVVHIGTTFRIILPSVSGAELPAAAAALAPMLATGSETVLLVEDEPGVRDLSTLALRQAGYTVLAAAGPEEAIRLARAHHEGIDLILTDVIMPFMSGPALVEWLATRFPGAKVLYMSGYTDDALAPHGVPLEDIELLQKPFTPTTLCRRIREVLDARDAEVAA